MAVRITVNGLGGPRCFVMAATEWSFFQVKQAIGQKLDIPVLWQTLLHGCERLPSQAAVGTLIGDDESAKLQLTLVVEEPTVEFLKLLWQENPGEASVYSVRVAVSEGLVVLMQQGRESQREAAMALQDLTRHEQVNLAGSPSMIQALLNLLLSGSDVREEAADVMWNLSQNHAANQVAIANFPAALPSLVALLKDGDDLGKWAATHVLHGLVANNAKTAVAVASVPDALTYLVQILQEGPQACTEAAAGGLEHLALVSSVRATITSIPEAMSALVTCMLDGVDASKGVAARALLNLVWNAERTIEALMEMPGALATLSQLLEDGDLAAQQAAAETLGHLAWWKHASRVRGSSGIVPALVGLLWQPGIHEEGRAAAAQALWNLHYDDRDLEVTLGGSGGRVLALVAVLQKGSRDHQAAAAAALGELALRHQNLAHMPGVLTSLVHVLKDGNEDGQEAAAAFVRNLALNGNMEMIREVPGLVQALEMMLTRGRGPGRDIAREIVTFLCLRD